MLAKRIIPCLDIKDGRVVKGTKFKELKDAGNPVELGKLYNNEGADELVFLDITASSDKRYILKDLVKKIANEIYIPFTVGGGINSIEMIQDMLKSGADKVSINTAAISDPELVKRASLQFGAQCIVVAIDAKRINSNEKYTTEIENNHIKIENNSKWEVFTHGGRNRTGIDAIKWAKYIEKKGAGEILLTSMDQDGTKNGYDYELTEAISKNVNIPVIASGGAGKKEHIVKVLKKCEAALLASLLHFKELSIEEIKEECKKNNITMRIKNEKRKTNKYFSK